MPCHLTYIKEELETISSRYGSNVTFSQRASSHSTIRIGGETAAWYVPVEADELKYLTGFLKEQDIRAIIAGACSNMLFPDERMEVVVINLGGEMSDIEFSGDRVEVGAGRKLSSLIRESCSMGLCGLEGLVGIPGTVGGALAMNASYSGSISDSLESIQVMDDAGDLIRVDRRRIETGYRKLSWQGPGIIVRAAFRLAEGDPAEIKKRMISFFRAKMDSQPLGEKTIGCIFKNPAGAETSRAAAWELIDMAGMRGFRRGGARISEKHANFIINESGASSSDVKSLISLVKEKVRQSQGTELEEEIKVL